MPTNSPAHRWLRLLLVLLTLGSAFAGQYYLSIQYVPLRAALGWGGACLSFLVLFILGRDTRALPTTREDALPARFEWILLAAVLAAGAFFKLYRLSEFPPGLNHDAAWEGQYALAILKGNMPYAPYVSAAWGRETLTFYFRAVSIWLFGNVPLGVYGPSVVAGILILPFLYGWVRIMFGARTALLATVLLGVSGWSLVFSRTGWRSDFQPLFTVITCFFFVRAMRSRSVLDFAAAGIALAATLNIYNAARVFPLLFAIWLPIFMLQSWHWRGFLKRYGLGLLTMAVSFGLAISPLAWYAAHNWTKFQGRANFLVGSQSYLGNLKKSLLMFHLFANGDDFFTTTPGLEFYSAIFLTFGLLWCVLRLRDERAQFLVIGLAIGVLPGFVSNPNMNRNIGAMPFVFILAGLGVVYFLRELARVIPRIGPAVATLCAIAVAVAAAAASYAQYLGPHARSVWGFYPETTVLGRYMATIMPRYRVWVGGANFPRDTLVYLTYQGGDPFQASFTWLDDVTALTRSAQITPGDRGLAFIIANEGVGTVVLSDLRRRYPHHQVVDLYYPERGDNRRVFARAVLVPPASEAGAQGEPDAEMPAAIPEGEAVELPANAAPGDLQEPRGVAVLSDGTVAVCDFGHDRFQIFDRDLKIVKAVGSSGEEAGQFKQPAGAAAGPNDEIFIADTWNHRIQVFGKDGSFKRQWMGSFFSPRGVAVDKEGNVYVADSGNNRVVRSTSRGDKLAEWSGAGGGKFMEPIGIAVDSSFRVYVADNGNGQLQIFTRDGKAVAAFPVKGWAGKAYSEPGVAVDNKGLIWVTVPGEREIRAYDIQGSLKTTITGASIKGTPFGIPMSIAFDAGTQTFVVSDLANRLFRLKPQ